MKKERRPRGHNRYEDEDWSVEDAIRYYGTVMIDFCPTWNSNLTLPGTSPADNKLYYCAAHLISQFGGLEWLREFMATSGHPMPEPVYIRLKAAEDNHDAKRRADFPKEFDGELWMEGEEWDGAIFGIVLLECLREEFPAYYTIVMDVLYAVLARHGSR